MDNTDIINLQNEIQRLQMEIERLHRIMDKAGVSYQLTPKEILDANQHINPVKITLENMRLFYALFKGRRDVYAVRYVGKNGRAGYSPKCGNFWKDKICPKRIKKFKCADCTKQNYLPLGKVAIENHLLGRRADCSDVLGIYVMDENEMCSLLVFDFDNHDEDGLKAEAEGANAGITWIEEVNAMRAICKACSVEAYFERSRSGKGAHIWIFFAELILASLAREFGAALLTKGAEYVALKSFRYYDRMIPNQDHMPPGGFGNLVALPLQGRALLNGNSAFIDENWQAYPDQWQYLKSIKRIEKKFVENFVKENSEDGCLGILSTTKSDDEVEKPWKKSKILFKAEDVDGTMELTFANQVYVRTDNLKPGIQNQLRRLAAFSNPEFYKNQAMRYSVNGIPRIIYCGSVEPGYIGIPRGKIEQLLKLLKESRIAYNLQDVRQAGRDIKVKFIGKLRETQQAAADKMLMYDNGILNAATAFGKTAVGSFLIAAKQVNTLVLVHNREIMKNWQEDFAKFLEVDEELPEYKTASGRIRKRKSMVGTLYSGHNTLTGIIDIAMVTSLTTKDEVSEIVKNYGMVIMDECHHAGALNAEKVLKEVNAKYVYGLTATLKRDDGLEQKVLMQFGPVRYRYTAKEKAEQQGIDHYVYPRFTRLVNLGEKWKINKAYEEVRNSETRNA